MPEKTKGPVCRDAIDLRPRKHRRAYSRGSMRCPCPKRPKGLLAGTQLNCGPSNTAGPVVREACDAHARKDRRAGLQGHNRLASPQTPQSLLSGKHAMPVPEKNEGPVSRDAKQLRPANSAGPVAGEACDARARKVRRAGLQGLRPRKVCRACCKRSIRCAVLESPNILFSNKFERHFAARAAIAAQTPICSPNANSLPIARLQPKRQFAYLMHFRSPNAFKLPKRMYTRGAAPQRPQGLLPGRHAMCDPEKSEGPVGRDAIELRPRKHRRAYSRGGMRCPCPKRPKGRLAGTQTNCDPANTAGPAVGEACDAHARKNRRAC